MKNSRKKTISTYRVNNSNKSNSKILKLISSSNPEDLNLEFEHYDGTFRNIPVHKTFFRDEKNNRLRPAEILSKIFTLKHDFGAKKFNLTNLNKNGK